MQRYLTVVMASGLASVLFLSGCSSEDADETSPVATSSTMTSAATTTDRPLIAPFGQPLVGASGAEITIDSVEDIGGVTVIGILYTAGDTAIEGYNLLTPDLTYGPKGVDAESDSSNSSDIFSGVVPPRTAKLLNWAYEVPLAELNPATLTVGIGLASPSWTGDLSTFDPAAPPLAPPVTTTTSSATPDGDKADALQPTGDALVDQISAAFGVAVSLNDAEQIAGDICTQFSDLGSSREEVIANVVRLEGTGEAFAGQIVDIAVKNECPQYE